MTPSLAPASRGGPGHTASPGGPLPPDPDELSLLLSTQLHLHDQAGSGASQGFSPGSSPARGALSGLERERKALAASCPRVLQPPRLYRRVCVPALLRGGSVLATGPEGPRAGHMIQQLPPPCRGLPCFTSAPQGLGLVRHPKQRTLPGPRRGSGPGMEEPDHPPPSARVPPPPTLSLLPKPKIHSPARLVTADDSSMTVLSVSTVHPPLTG